MDKLNRKIVSHLLQDGRATFAEIGEVVGLSAPAVKRRVDAMRASGEISGFTVVVNPHSLGWSVEAYTEIFCRGNQTPAHLRAEFGPIASIVELFTVTGDADAMARIMASSMAEMEQVVERIRESPNVERTRTSMVMSRVIDRPNGSTDLTSK